MKKKISSFGKFLSKIPLFVAKRVFVFGLVVFFLAFILSGIIFYQRVISFQESDDSASESLFRIDENNYQKFLDFQQKQEETFNNAGVQSYRDIFRY
jgi:hypothetical protein